MSGASCELYADENYYRNTYLGKYEGSDEELRKMLGVASRKIDGITFNRIGVCGFEGLSEFQKECLRQACCFQTDYMFENGTDGGASMSGYSVADIRVSYSGNAANKASMSGFSQTAYEFVELSGFLYRGV